MEMVTQKTFTRPQAFAALRAIVKSLSTAWDLDSILDLIVHKTTEVMHVDSCTIYLLDPDGETLRLQASTGLSKRALGRSTLRMGEGMTGYAVARNRAVFAADAQHDPLYKLVDEAEETRYQSLLAVPLVIENQPIGAMNVQTVAMHLYTPDEVEVLTLIGDLAAGTLVRAQLHDKQARQIEELRTLAEVSEAVTSPQYLHDILDIVSEMAAQVMEAAIVIIYLLDESGQFLERHTGPLRPHIARRQIPIAGGTLAQVVVLGQSIYVADVRVEAVHEERELAVQENLVALLAVPLRVRDRVIGVLNCYTAVAHEFTTEQETLLTTLANQTALAIENAQLVTNTAVVREMHHRIKNNLQTVAMLMQMQIAEVDRLDARQVLETSIQRVRSIAAVHEALSEKSFRMVDVKDVLERIIKATAVNMVAPQKEIAIRVLGEALQLPSRSATSLALVVNELVQNALEHAFVGRENGKISISLGHSPVEYIILVKDDGVGLPLDLHPNLGLEIAETLVCEDMRGRIKFNRLESGTEISIRIPRSVERDL